MSASRPDIRQWPLPSQTNDPSPDAFLYQNQYLNQFSMQIQDPVLNQSISYNDKGMDRSDTELSKSSWSKKVSLSRSHSAFVHFLRDWWLELVSAFFLIGGLIAIIITAREYQDKPLPHLPQGISINSLIAIYIVILKAAMLLILAQGLSHLKWTWFSQTRPLNDLARYDNASRGPLGSLWLLCTLRGRDVISSVGALIIIAAVILDPMAQQVIRYYNCSIISDGVNATLPRTNAYMELGAHAGAGINTMPFALQSAINGGIFSPGAQVTPDCQSGNCTFPNAVHTVGFASNCVDVSAELTFSNVSITQYNQAQSSDGSGLTTVSYNLTALNATLPSGLSTSYQVSWQQSTYMVMAYNSTLGAIEIIRGPQSQYFQPGQTYCSDREDPSSWSCQGYGAARCSLVPAIYTISNTSIKAGKLEESLAFAQTLKSSETAFSGTSGALTYVPCLTSDQKRALMKLGYEIPSALQWLKYNASLSMSGNLVGNGMDDSTNATLQIVPKECIYQVNGPTINSIDAFFSDFFSGSIVPWGTEWTGNNIAKAFYQTGYEIDIVSGIFLNISTAMTTYIRQNGFANNSEPALGQVIETQTCIRVRWALIAYPAALTGLTLVFFMAMILYSSRKQQGVHHDFKSSPLALLFHGLDDQTARRVENARKGESNEVEDLSAEAKGMWVRLRPTDRGWRFVASEKEGGARVNDRIA